MADYIYIMESRLTPEQQRGVTLVQDVARAHGMNIYLAGGVVRDIISGATIRDLDFTVQGNALKLHKDLERAGAIVHGTDEHYHSLYVWLPGNLRGEISSARTETYEKPGRPPEITPTTINEDVRRRDFTINAMALSLNPGSRGLLLDPFNGVADIEAKVLRILHNYSFLEEPSRMIRATRFMARFEWTMEERTLARYEAAKENKYMEYVNKKLIGHEIEQVAHEPDPLKVMRALEKENWLHVLHPHWSVAKVDVSGLNHLLKIRQQLADAGYTMDAGPAVMHFLTAKMNGSDLAHLQAAIPRKAFVTMWKELEHDAKAFTKELLGKNGVLPSQAWKMLSGAKPESILFTAATTKQSEAAKKIADFLGKWRQMKARLPLPEMAELRITTDLPEYPKLAEEVFLLLLDGKLKSHTEIINFLKPYSPPEPVAPPPPPRRARAKKAEAGTDGAAKKTRRGRKQAQILTEGTMAAEGMNTIAENIGTALGKAVKGAKTILEPATAAVKEAGEKAQKAASSSIKNVTASAKKAAKTAKKAVSAKPKKTAKKQPAKVKKSGSKAKKKK